jgi:2-amino-4-hydroxy-6-hydroxymethyldihydropteridine diphosphokinase
MSGVRCSSACCVPIAVGRRSGPTRTADHLALVAVAIGSNLGDRESHMAFARSRLRALLGSVRASSSYETAPEGVEGEQSAFLNAAVIGETHLSARDVLDALFAIEAERGRERPFARAPRTLDLDLVLFGDQIIDEPGLTVPHPRFRERRFVLEPLAEIAPDLRDPVSRKSIAELLDELTRSTPDHEALRR